MSTLVAQTISNGTVSTSSQHVIQGSAKAWLNLSLTGGVATTRGSYNISSVTRTGTGQGYATLTTSMPNANYAVVCGGSENNTTGTARFTTAWVTSESRFDFSGVSYIGSITYGDNATLSFAVLSS